MAEPLWTSDAADDAAGGQSSAPWAANGVSIDSRSLAPGDLFVALKDVRDGHDFVAAAFEAGASAALVVSVLSVGLRMSSSLIRAPILTRAD